MYLWIMPKSSDQEQDAKININIKQKQDFLHKTEDRERSLLIY